MKRNAVICACAGLFSLWLACGGGAESPGSDNGGITDQATHDVNQQEELVGDASEMPDTASDMTEADVLVDQSVVDTCWGFLSCMKSCKSIPSVCAESCKKGLSQQTGNEVALLHNCLASEDCYKDDGGSLLTCLNEHCLDKYVQCYSHGDNKPCVFLEACWNVCEAIFPSDEEVGIFGCKNDCDTEFPTGHPQLVQQMDCQVDSCEPLDCYKGELSSKPLSERLKCYECFAQALCTSCSDKYKPCMGEGGKDCGEVLSCYLECPSNDSDCLTSCNFQGTFEAQCTFSQLWWACITPHCVGEEDWDACVVSALENSCKDKHSQCVE